MIHRHEQYYTRRMNVTEQMSNEKDFRAAQEALKAADVSKAKEKGTVHTWWTFLPVSFNFILSTLQNSSVRRSLF